MLSISRIPGSKQELSDQVTVQILLDRNLLLEVGRSVLVILTVDEAAALYHYLHSHKRKFVKVGGGE